jgi:hypothetical protein
MNNGTIMQLMEYADSLSRLKTLAIVYSAAKQDAAYIAVREEEISEKSQPLQVTIYQEVFDTCYAYSVTGTPDIETFIRNTAAHFVSTYGRDKCKVVTILLHVERASLIVYGFPRDIAGIGYSVFKKDRHGVISALNTRLGKNKRAELQYLHVVIWSVVSSGSGTSFEGT